MNKNISRTAEIARLKKLDRRYEDLSKYCRNLNLQVLLGQVGAVYNRESIIDTLQKILLRRNKANILLTGAAGCGKTAIAEGLAHRITEINLKWRKQVSEEEAEMLDEALDLKRYSRTPLPLFADCIVYELSMNALLSGCKYRGEFEEKLQKVMDIVAADKNIILFVDEIHQINDIGTAEGGATAGMGQIMKPALARNEIRLIGATTTQEAEKYIKTDKALMRRFTEVIVPQIQGESAVQCLEKIMVDYAEYHDVKIKGVDAKTLLEKVQYFIPDGIFPNNVIDIIDETLAAAKFDGKKIVKMAEIIQTLSRITGLVIC